MLSTNALYHKASPMNLSKGMRGRAQDRVMSSRRWRRIMEGVSLWLAVLMLLFVQPMYAEAESRGEEPGSGALEFLDAKGQPTGLATVMNTEYEVDVSGLIADVRLTQTFENPSREWREAMYVFPLPEKATVYGFTMMAGERRIVGEIKEKEEARREYAKAKSEGRKVARVDQQRPNLFTTHLANLPPGETISVELRYQQTVRYQSGEFELRLPTTLTPRYMPGAVVTEGAETWQQGWALPTTEVPDADEISPFTVRPDDVPSDSHRARVSMNLEAGMPLSRVDSPSHQLTTTWNGHRVDVSPVDDAIVMDRDLIVRWAPTRAMAPSAAVFHQQWQGEDYVLAMMVPGLSSGTTLARELIFVIDTSGSMAGESIRQARSSLLSGLETLEPSDRFNVIQFNSQTASLFIDPVPATGNNIARAQRYVQGLRADGGTEMAPALDAALRPNEGSSEESSQLVRQVVFITDGSVGNEAALFQRIRRQLGDARLFTVGIGSAPNMHFMREAARFGRGTYTAINQVSDVARPLDELFSKMQSAVLTDIQVRWPDSQVQESALPRRIGDLFLGEPLVQVVRGQAPEGEVQLSGRLPDGSQWKRSLDLSKAAPASGLNRLWARHQIDGLLDARKLRSDVASDSATDTKDRSADLRESVVKLGIKHQLVTPYTSFLAVDKTPARPLEQQLASDSVPTLLPAGSKNSMLRYPQTATASPLLIALGLLGMMLSAAIGLLKGRVFS